ncbi:MAG TPA: hypothetical protein VE912_05510 [Bacteroidales bacterium]|nr:hypothetical protein [Bacteroidales bacterium]
MKKLMHILFLSCLKATELIEKKMHFRLSWMERMQLKAHKMMCDACTRYEEQSAYIDQAIEKTRHENLSASELNQFKQQIVDKLGDSD